MELIKAVYRLNDTSQQWYIIVKEVIEKLYQNFDPGLFQYYSDNKLGLVVKVLDS